MKKRLLILVASLLLISSQAFASDFKMVMTDPIPQVDKITFTNDEISAKFFLQGKNIINLEIQNLTNKMIKIDWNQIAFVDTEQKTHKVIHTGVLYKDRNELQAPTIIPPIPMTKINDALFPLDLIEFKSNIWTGAKWVSNNFISDQDDQKSLAVFIPLDIGGTVKYYTFQFKLVKEKSN